MVNALTDYLMETEGREAVVRYIDWPKQTPGKGYFDVYSPGFMSIALSNKLSDETLTRLFEFFDWTYTDEGLQTITWGPEEAGLWHYVDGARRIIDPELEANLLAGVVEPNGARTWGLLDSTGVGNAWSKLVTATPHLVTTAANPFSVTRSVPPNIDFHSFHRNLLGTSGTDFLTRRGSNGNGGTNCNSVAGYFWSDFLGRDIATLFDAKNDAEFDYIWDNVILVNFEELGHYSAAVAEMEIWFDRFYVGD